VTDGLSPSGAWTTEAATYVVPFDHEAPNEASVTHIDMGTNVGVRFLQLVSQYMFEGCAAGELSLFTRLDVESRSLVWTLVDAVATHFQHSNDIRDKVISYVCEHFGKGIFLTNAEVYNGAYGDMLPVLQAVGEMFLVFTVTLIMVIRNAAGVAVERFAVRRVPLIFRLS
jgi:hypothetical protein